MDPDGVKGIWDGLLLPSLSLMTTCLAGSGFVPSTYPKNPAPLIYGVIWVHQRMKLVPESFSVTWPERPEVTVVAEEAMAGSVGGGSDES